MKASWVELLLLLAQDYKIQWKERDCFLEKRGQQRCAHSGVPLVKHGGGVHTLSV